MATSNETMNRSGDRTKPNALYEPVDVMDGDADDAV